MWVRALFGFLIVLVSAVTWADAHLEAPSKTEIGADIAVTVTGSTNPRDFVSIVAKGAREGMYTDYVNVSKPGGIKLRAPTTPGEYEIRLLGAAAPYPTLASSPLVVETTSASLEAPEQAKAGSDISVRWKGPGNAQDYIGIGNARQAYISYFYYTRQGNPLTVRAPDQNGDYEVRYFLGSDNKVIASRKISIVGAREPGHVSVTGSGALSADGAVEIILDASGSMLQKIGSQRRIDIARQTLTKLTAETIPAGTPFALRVFGREASSCQTDLDIPLAPLNPAAASARINALEAKNNAKTPIGASLQKVADDLRNVRGERLVILVTDGEETCGGDPAATIETLKKSGVNLRLNIVGFAVDEPAIAATFRHWTNAGNGLYFDAKDAAGLGHALTQAVRQSFEVVDSQGRVLAEGLVGGDAVAVPPGDHVVRLKGHGSGQSVTVKEKQTVTLKL